MPHWQVLFHDEFRGEFRTFTEEVQDELYAQVRLLKVLGPELKRPHADTLHGSRHQNMKELRFNAADGVWRAAYAFDPLRRATLLVAADKSGQNEKLFYRRLIAKADRRFSDHLARLKGRGR